MIDLWGAPEKEPNAATVGTRRPAPASLPTRAHPRGTEPISTLLDLPSVAGEQRVARGPAGLIRRYDGQLAIDLAPDRPVIIANFATTLDGAVAMDRHGTSGGGDVSGFSPTDRFVMGLLRAVADTVIVGAGTVRASSGRAWTPDAVSPGHAADYAELRRDLGLEPQPTTLILTSTGDLDPRHPALVAPRSPTIVAGPASAVTLVRNTGLSREIEIRTTGAADAGDMNGVAGVIAALGGRVALFEGGPRLFGAFLAAGLIDELFLTVSPQLVGRADGRARLSLVDGTALWPGLPTWGRLRSVKSAGNHLLLRYRL